MGPNLDRNITFNYIVNNFQDKFLDIFILTNLLTFITLVSILHGNSQQNQNIFGTKSGCFWNFPLFRMCARIWDILAPILMPCIKNCIWNIIINSSFPSKPDIYWDQTKKVGMNPELTLKPFPFSHKC